MASLISAFNLRGEKNIFYEQCCYSHLRVVMYVNMAGGDRDSSTLGAYPLTLIGPHWVSVR